jgi:hypothetical protein
LDAQHTEAEKTYQTRRAELAGKMNGAAQVVHFAGEAARLKTDLERRFAPLFTPDGEFENSLVDPPLVVRNIAVAAGLFDNGTPQLGVDADRDAQARADRRAAQIAAQTANIRAENERRTQPLKSQQLRPEEPNDNWQKVEHVL